MDAQIQKSNITADSGAKSAAGGNKWRHYNRKAKWVADQHAKDEVAGQGHLVAGAYDLTTSPKLEAAILPKSDDVEPARDKFVSKPVLNKLETDSPNYVMTIIGNYSGSKDPHSLLAQLVSASDEIIMNNVVADIRKLQTLLEQGLDQYRKFYTDATVTPGWEQRGEGFRLIHDLTKQLERKFDYLQIAIPTAESSSSLFLPGVDGPVSTQRQ